MSIRKLSAFHNVPLFHTVERNMLPVSSMPKIRSETSNFLLGKFHIQIVQILETFKVKVGNYKTKAKKKTPAVKSGLS